MAALITRTRLLIGDPSGASQVFTDQQLQDALDAHRTFIQRERLRAEPTYSSTQTLYVDHFSLFDNLEDDTAGAGAEPPSFQTLSYAAVTWDTKDFLTGHFTKTAGQDPPVYFTGRTYDVNAAAADLLEAWAGKTKLDFNFSTGTGSYSRQQKFADLMDLAKLYRKKSRVTVSTAERSDTR